MSLLRDHASDDVLLAMLAEIEQRLSRIERAGEVDAEPLPRAIPTGLLHCGRRTFVVEGKTGLWIARPQMTGAFDLSTPITAAHDSPRRGRQRTMTLYRQSKLSDWLNKCLNEGGFDEEHDA